MTGFPQNLRVSFTDAETREEAARGHDRIGLSGLLNARGTRARVRRVPGVAVYGFRWALRDVWNQTWWPQGITLGEHNGRRLLITSWFAQEKRGVQMGSRISMVDLGDPARPRYHHVLLVAPRREGDATVLDPVVVHAGGIAVSGDRLFVAATFGGIREFRLSDIMRAPDRGVLRRPGGPFGYRYLLPEYAGFGQSKKREGGRMRYSFLSVESALAAGSPGESATAGGEVRLVSGEYGTDDTQRLARFRLLESSTEIDEIHSPGIAGMQGAAVHEGRWFVSATQGDKANGDLWVGDPAALVRHAAVLPPGPEDVAVDAENGWLWSVSEFPGKRWVFALDLPS